MSNKVDKIKYDGMESLVTAIIVCDKDLIINYINPSTETLFEVSAKQAVNNNISIFFEDTNNFFKKILQKVEEQKTIWQLINIALPLLLLGIFGLIFNYIRKRKYA